MTSAIGTKQTKLIAAYPKANIRLATLNKNTETEILDTAVLQISDDTCGRAPDVAAAELHGVKAQGEPIPVATFALVVFGRHQ